MSRIFRFAFFLGVVISIYYFLHYYIFNSIIRGLSLTGLSREIIKYFFIIGALSFVASEFLSRTYDFNYLSYFGSIWLGLLSISISVLLLKDLLSLLMPQWKGLLTLLSLFLVVGLTFLSTYNVSGEPVIKDVAIKTDKQVDNITLIHLTDVHISSTSSRERLERLVETVNKLKPDVVVITGDLIDDRYERVSHFASVIKNFSSKWGTFAVSGNHEYYAGLSGFEKFADEAKVTILKNSNVNLGENIILAGINDSSAKDFSLEGPNLDKTLTEIDKNKMVILLSHKPKGFEESVDKGVDLQLSGHTHSGQIPPLNLLVPLAYKYHSDLKQYKSSYIYTSPGTSTWGPPMRLFSRNEVTRIIISPN